MWDECSRKLTWIQNLPGDSDAHNVRSNLGLLNEARRFHELCRAFVLYFQSQETSSVSVPSLKVEYNFHG
jgi:hypothetical protein